MCGIRHPAVECVTGTYASFSKREDGTIQEMFGNVVPFSKEKLTALYGSLDNYRRLAHESTDRAVAEGYVLREDADLLVERVVSAAAGRGLG